MLFCVRINELKWVILFYCLLKSGNRKPKFAIILYFGILYGDSMLNTDRLCLGCMNDCGGEKVCAICGYDSATRNPNDCLPTKLWLNDRYLVGKVVERTAGCISYIGWDNADDSIVTIREFFPSHIAYRNPDKTVSVSENDKYTYNGGLMNFLEINQKLKNANLPSVIPSKDVFEENGTAYAVSAAFTGIVLSDFLNRNGGTLEWEQVRPLFLPFMDTLKALHEMGIICGNISPDTILVGRDGKLRLANICVSADKGYVKNELFDGFSAIEQYDTEKYTLTASSDVYSVSATLFNVLIGTIPPAAPMRLENDSLSVSSKFAEKVPRNVLVALANGIQVLPEKRTLDIESFRGELVYGNAPDGSDLNKNKPRKSETKDTENGKKKAKKGLSGVKTAVLTAVCTVLVFAILGTVLSLTVFKDYFFPKETVEKPVDSQSSIPSSQVIGTIDEGAQETPKQYAVPNFVGEKYSAVLEDAEDKYKNFVITVKNKMHSDKYKRGEVCEQNINAGTSVTKNTEIQLTISLGPAEVNVPRVLDLTLDKAMIELLKRGFAYDNISIEEKYDEDASPNVVIDQTPNADTKVSIDSKIEIFVNTYSGEEEE